MLIGKKCTVGTMTNKEAEGFTSYKGEIACEPQMAQDSGDFWVLVCADGVLNRVDTDYIFDVGI